MNSPPGYALLRREGARALALPGAALWTEGLLDAGDTLHGWAARHPERRLLTGRGETYSVPAPLTLEGDAAGRRWVVRHYRRGGLLARALGDRYLAVGVPRPFREAGASAQARERGIPTPRVVAAAAHAAGAFYRADLVTEEIPEGLDLAAFLAPNRGASQAAAGLTATGGLVRAWEVRGVFHPDLHARNVVVQLSGGGAAAHVVDLDRCRVRRRGVPAPALPMRRRLEGSLRKLEARGEIALPPGGWDALRAGYAAS